MPVRLYRYACPKKGDSWKDDLLGDELVAKYATGPGCYVEYTFRGTSTNLVQIKQAGHRNVKLRDPTELAGDTVQICETW